MGLTENKGYWWLFVISASGASLEYWFAWHLGNSEAALADAAHAYSHSALHFIAIYTTRKSIPAHKADEMRSKGYFAALILLLVTLGYLANSAVARFWAAPEILPSLMKLGVFLGLCSNVVSIVVLRKIKAALKKDNALRKILNWDTFLDFLISLAVFTSAFFIHLAPWIDSAVTLLAVSVIGYIAFASLINKLQHEH